MSTLIPLSKSCLTKGERCATGTEPMYESLSHGPSAMSLDCDRCNGSWAGRPDRAILCDCRRRAGAARSQSVGCFRIRVVLFLEGIHHRLCCRVAALAHRLHQDAVTLANGC